MTIRSPEHDTTRKDALQSTSHSGLIQPKCSCGGASGFGHSCAPCQAKKLAGPQSSLNLAGTRDLLGHTPDEIRRPSLPNMAQPKLKVGQPNDSYEQEADQVAEQVMRMPAAGTLESHARSSSAAIQRACLDCEEEDEELIHRTEATRHVPEVTPSLAAQIGESRTGGQPLPDSTRKFFEPRFRQDLSKIRVHVDTRASDLAHSLGARAFTLGNNIFFGQGSYSPETIGGRLLMAHELVHTIQQSGESSQNTLARTPEIRIQRQFVTPLAPGGGFRGLMERDRQFNRRLAATPYHVCSRPLQIGGFLFNHAYIQAPPFKYAVIGPRCTPTDGGPDGLFRGTVTSKWDNSPDPCDQRPVNRVPCEPRDGVTDVGQCLRDAYDSYNSPMLYRLQGPNSNTFAGTLARACCANMVPKPDRLGRLPGWDDPPARARQGDCPDAPSCD